MEPITLIGYAAGISTTISFLPQVIKTWKLRETRDLSLLMYSLFCTGIFLWLLYGLFIKDYPIIIANLVTFILASTVLGFKIRYG